MKVVIKGKGEAVQYVDLQELPTTKEFVKFKKETLETIDKLKAELEETKLELQKVKLSNVDIVKGLIER